MQEHFWGFGCRQGSQAQPPSSLGVSAQGLAGFADWRWGDGPLRTGVGAGVSWTLGEEWRWFPHGVPGGPVGQSQPGRSGKARYGALCLVLGNAGQWKWVKLPDINPPGPQ